ncbi:MAG: copper resistance protein CopC, partial [Gemmatimonadetes bacterium]|nr:copper resistance protein CopC [Gemmatimonadota bacterium]
MSMPLTLSGFARRCSTALLFAVVFLVPAAAHAHIRLDASSPARDEVLTVMPLHLRLLFSGTIEARYTSVILIAPDGARVPTGAVVFVDGSDREISLSLPAIDQPGTWTVAWRTAGADGHVLEGSYTFVLAPDTGTSRERDPAGGVDTTQLPAGDTAIPLQAGGHAHGDHEDPESVGGARDAIGRGLHFTALILLLGGVTFRAL